MSAPSTHSLFRATRKAPAPVVPMALALPDDLGAAPKRAKPEVREADDFYPTPAEPVRALLTAEANALDTAHFEFGSDVWEAAVGDGAIARELIRAGYSVIGSDLRDRGWPDTQVGDFFALQDALSPIMITNPPYDCVNWRDGKGRWITHARAIGVRYMALLLNWSWLGAAGLRPLLEADPPARVWVCQWKIDFTGEGAPPQLNAWFVWDDTTTRGNWGGTRLGWLSRDSDPVQGVML